MPEHILSPQRIATEAFTDASKAVARLAEIYERNVDSCAVRSRPMSKATRSRRAYVPPIPLSGSPPARTPA